MWIPPDCPFVTPHRTEIVQELLIGNEMIAVVCDQPLGRLHDTNALVGRRYDRLDVANLAKAGDEIVDPARAGETAPHDMLLHLPGRGPGGAIILVIDGVESDNETPHHDRPGVAHQPGDHAVVGKEPDERIDMGAAGGRKSRMG